MSLYRIGSKTDLTTSGLSAWAASLAQRLTNSQFLSISDLRVPSRDCATMRSSRPRRIDSRKSRSNGVSRDVRPESDRLNLTV